MDPLQAGNGGAEEESHCAEEEEEVDPRIQVREGLLSRSKTVSDSVTSKCGL